MVYIHYSDVENPVNEPWGSSSLGLWDGHGDLQDPRDHATIMGIPNFSMLSPINGGIPFIAKKTHVVW